MYPSSGRILCSSAPAVWHYPSCKNPGSLKSVVMVDSQCPVNGFAASTRKSLPNILPRSTVKHQLAHHQCPSPTLTPESLMAKKASSSAPMLVGPRNSSNKDPGSTCRNPSKSPTLLLCCPLALKNLASPNTSSLSYSKTKKLSSKPSANTCPMLKKTIGSLSPQANASK